MSYINIPRDRNDPNYRYKMPKLVSKIEGRGNGIRTNISNMGEIARSLKRPPMYPTKFFGCELGTMVKFEENEEKAIVNGAHKEKDLVNILDKFIEMYVLCPHCLLPETDIIVKKGFLICKCNACGNIGELNNSHKIVTYMIKNPQVISTVGNKKKKIKEKKPDKNGKNKNGTHSGEDNEGSDDLDTDKSNQNVKKEKKNKKKDKDKDKKKKLEDNFVLEKESLNFESPEIKEVIDRLQSLFEANPKMLNNSFSEELRVLQVSQSFDSKCKIYICLSALFGDKITVELLEKNIKYLKKINDTSVTVNDIFISLEYYVNKIAIESINIYPYILQVLYNNDIFESRDIIKRYDENKTGITEKVNGNCDDNSVDIECYNKCKDMAKHFVKWLKENDSDSESEEEGSETNNTAINHVNYKVKSLHNNEDKINKENNISNENDKLFEDSKSEKCDDNIFLDARDGINYTDEEEIDIDAI